MCHGGPWVDRATTALQLWEVKKSVKSWPKTSQNAQMLHGAGIFTYIWTIFGANVGKLYHTWSIWDGFGIAWPISDQLGSAHGSLVGNHRIFFPVTKGLEETQRCDIQTKSLLVIAELSPFGRTIVTMVTASIYKNQWCAGDRQSHGYFFWGGTILGGNCCV